MLGAGKDRILRTWSESNGHENGNGNSTPSPLQTQAPVASAAAPSGQLEASAGSGPASSSVLEAPVAAESVPAAPLPLDSVAQPDAGQTAAEASDSELTGEAGLRSQQLPICGCENGLALMHL